LEEAVATGEKAIALRPGDALAHRHLGWVFDKLGRRAEARRVYEQSVALNPHDAAAQLGLVHLLDGPEQESALLEAIALHAGNSRLRHRLGNYYRRKGQLDDAVGQYREALKFLPWSNNSRENLCKVLQQQGRLGEAIEEWRTMAAAEGTALAWQRLGVGLYFASRYDAALTAFREVIERNPTLLAAHRRVVSCHSELGRREEAVVAAERAVALDPLNAGLAVQLSQAYYDVGEFESAARVARVAVEGKSFRHSPHTALGDALTRLGDREGAVRSYCQAVRFWGGNPKKPYRWFTGLWRLMRAEPPPTNLAVELDGLLEAVTWRVSSRPVYFPRRLRTLSLGWLYHPERSNAAKALDYARTAVRQSKGLDALAYLTLAEVQAHAGHFQKADEALREALGKESLAEHRGLWNRWLANALNGLAAAPESLLQRLPKVTSRHGEDMAWLLGELAVGGVLRLNCGGDEIEGEAGLWWRDGFFVRGSAKAYTGDIQGTEDDRLYRTQRLYPGAYRVPVLDGDYRVTLHFAELESPLESGPELRRFEVLLEGAVVLPAYSPSEHGLRVADPRDFPTRVRDGVLDIEFRGFTALPPLVCAIEIRQGD